MPKHLVLFDGECSFCHRSVQHLLQIDRNHSLVFAPLQGKTAQEILVGSQVGLRQMDSLVFVENYRSAKRRFSIRSRAIFRIYRCVGGIWGWLGLLCFLPPFLGDVVYRWIARNRHRMACPTSLEKLPKDRFLS